MELILLRHGPTAGNLLRQYIGVTDQPLAPEGEALAGRWRNRLPAPELLFVSPLTRCRQTAALIWPDCPQTVVEQLRETNFGAFEGKRWEELKEDPRYRAWIDGAGDPPGGESRAQAAHRVGEGWRLCLSRIREETPHCCAIVAHGGTIMELLQAQLGGSLYHWQPKPCGGWRVTLEEDGTLSNPSPLSSPEPAKEIER